VLCRQNITAGDDVYRARVIIIVGETTYLRFLKKNQSRPKSLVRKGRKYKIRKEGVLSIRLARQGKKKREVPSIPSVQMRENWRARRERSWDDRQEVWPEDLGLKTHNFYEITNAGELLRSCGWGWTQEGKCSNPRCVERCTERRENRKGLKQDTTLGMTSSKKEAKKV